MSVPLTRRGEIVLVTGATGYVGSVVVERLLAAGYRVRGLTRSDEGARSLTTRGVEPVVGDVADTSRIRDYADGISAVVHTANLGAPIPGKSMEDAVAEAVSTMTALSDAAAENDARIVIMSGTSIYGDTGGKIVDETAPPQVPPFLTPFVEAEVALAQSGKAHILRSGVVYGRDQSTPMRETIGGVHALGHPAMVDAQHRLSMVHVDDLAELFVLILEAENPPQLLNGVGEVLHWPDVMRAVGIAANAGTDIKMIPPEAAMSLGGIAMYAPIDMAVSNEMAHSKLGWTPKAGGFANSI